MSFPTPTSPLYPLAVAYIKAANDKNSAAIEALLSDDFTAGNHPRTLLTPGMPTRVGKQAYIERGKQMFETVIDYLGVDIDHPVNVIEGKDSIVIQANSNGKLKSGVDFPQEFLYIIRFNAEQKICSIDIWNDSALAHQAFSGTSFPKVGKDGLVANLEDVAAAGRK